jgi:hypothetical protein
MSKQQDRPSEEMIAFLDTLARLGGDDVRTRTLTAKGFTQDQLRYRQDKLGEDGGDFLTVRTVGDRPGEEERLWSLTARGEWVVDNYRQTKGTPTTSDDAAPVTITQGEFKELQDRLRRLEEAVGL